MYHLHDGPYFTGTMLKAKVLRTASPEFNLFQVRRPVGMLPMLCVAEHLRMLCTLPQLARADSLGEREEVVTAVRGDGLLTHRGPIAASGRVSVSALFPAAETDTPQLEGGEPRSTLSLNGRLSAEQEKKRHTFQEAEALVSADCVVVCMWCVPHARLSSTALHRCGPRRAAAHPLLLGWGRRVLCLGRRTS